MQQFRFRPRHAALAWSAMVVGGVLIGLAVALRLAGANLIFTAGAGAFGVLLGVLYLASPAWRFCVLVDDAGIEVQDHHGDRRFRADWSALDRVIAAPATRTCLLSAGGPDRTLIVPGPGAPAPYDIEDKRTLYDLIIKHAPGHIVTEVESLDVLRHNRSTPSD
jgi:hypothetical protein